MNVCHIVFLLSRLLDIVNSVHIQNGSGLTSALTALLCNTLGIMSSIQILLHCKKKLIQWLSLSRDNGIQLHGVIRIIIIQLTMPLHIMIYKSAQGRVSSI